MLPEPDPPVASADCLALAQDLVARPFPAAPTGSYDWMCGRAQSGPDRHFVPVASSEVLEYAPAERWASAEDEIDERRREVTAVLVAAWGAPEVRLLESETVLADDEEIAPVVQDLALFAAGEADTWRRGERTVWLVDGQWDKDFPIVLMIAVTD